MLTIPVYNTQGKELESLSLSKNIFGLKVKPSLLHLVSTIFLANERKGTAKVKTRAERRGGGRKPFKQKGSASARAGTTRSPIWRKGGRVFGPTGEQNYHRELPKKVRVKAFLMSLSAKAQAKRIVAMDSLKLDTINTKSFAEIISKLPVNRSTLLVLPAKDQNITLSSRNIPNVTTRTFDNINTLDVLTHEYILVLADAVPMIEKKWGEYSFKGIMTDDELSAALQKSESQTIKAEKPAKAAQPAKPTKEPSAKKASKAKVAAKKGPKSSAKSSKA